MEGAEQLASPDSLHNQEAPRIKCPGNPSKSQSGYRDKSSGSEAGSALSVSASGSQRCACFLIEIPDCSLISSEVPHRGVGVL